MVFVEAEVLRLLAESAITGNHHDADEGIRASIGTARKECRSWECQDGVGRAFCGGRVGVGEDAGLEMEMEVEEGSEMRCGVQDHVPISARDLGALADGRTRLFLARSRKREYLLLLFSRQQAILLPR